MSVLIALSPVYGQTAVPANAAPPQSRTLNVFILRGQNAVNYLPSNPTPAIVVEIRDNNQFPVSDAKVTFTAPATGAGGQFADGQHTATVSSNSDGQAAVGFVPNRETGPYQISVEARVGDRYGRALISELNTDTQNQQELTGKHKKPWYRSWIFIGVVAAAGIAAGVILATRGGGGTSSKTVTITPGPPTVGAP
jgi:hypothetical protein